jgi:hypothetical protein
MGFRCLGGMYSEEEVDCEEEAMGGLALPWWWLLEGKGSQVTYIEQVA